MTDHDAGGPAARNVRVGALIAGYRLEEQIGTGGMAVVFRAHDRRLDRRVALKILTPDLASDKAFRERFIRESRAAAAVDDPHIIPVFEAGEAAGVLFIAMRYVRGGDVRFLIDRSGPLPPGRVADIISQVASALDAAHARGLVHRDVKPANMLLEARPADNLPDHVYLSDFGLTKASLGTSLALTATGEFMGTLEYVSPEQIQGRALDGRSDEYGLACSAFEMLCGRPPYRHAESMSVMYAHVHESPPPIRQFRADLPAAVEPVLGRALAKAAADRYASCGEFAAALRAALAMPSAGPPWPDAPQPDTVRARPPAGDSAAAASPGGTRQDRPPELAADLSRTQPSGQGAPTVPGITDTSQWADYPPQGYPPAGYPSPGRSRWRRSARVAGLCVLALALAGGGYALTTQGHQAGTAGHQAVTLTPPGCTRGVASAPQRNVGTDSVRAVGAFGVAVSGGYAFVSGGDAVTVLKTAGTAVTPVARISVPGARTGDAITHDGHYLLAAAGTGAVVISIKDALNNVPDPVVGRLSSPRGGGASHVALSPDDAYAFVTLQASAELAVYNLHAALTGGFSKSDFVGYVHVGAGPNGLAAAGGSLYVANEGGKELSVLSMSAAETHPGSAVPAMVPAGCQPARMLVSADGKVLWVTAVRSNAVLGFSTTRLRNHPQHALIAKVKVGEEPLGLALTTDGSRMIVVDSDQVPIQGDSSSLAVIDTAKALSGKQAVLGYIPTGVLPREAAFEQGGTTALITVTGAGQVQAVNVGDLR